MLGALAFMLVGRNMSIAHYTFVHLQYIVKLIIQFSNEKKSSGPVSYVPFAPHFLLTEAHNKPNIHMHRSPGAD